MYQSINKKPSFSERRQQKKRSEAIRGIARAYEAACKKEDFIPFINSMDMSLTFKLFLLSPRLSTKQYDQAISEFATRVFSGVLLSKEIINNPALKKEKILTLDLLGEHYVDNEEAIEDTKKLIIKCVQGCVADGIRKASTKKPQIVYIQQDAADELSKGTMSDFLQRYSDEMTLIKSLNSLKIEVQFTESNILSCSAALDHYRKLLESLVRQENYKKYEAAVSEILWEFDNVMDDPDELLCHYIDILKNAHALIVETEALRVTGAYKADAVQSQEGSGGAFNRYTESVNSLMSSPAIEQERKKNMLKACVSIVGVVLLVATIAVVSTVATAGLNIPAFLVALGGGIFAVPMVQQGVYSFFRVGQHSAHAPRSRFRDVGLFAKKVEDISRNPDGNASEARPVCKAV